MVVVRAFDNDAVAHPKGSLDPQRDLRYIEEEFILQDQLVVEKRLERIHRELRTRKVPELEREAELLKRCQAVLEDERPLRSETFDEQEEKVLRGFTFLSAKPMLVVLNVGDHQVSDESFSNPRWAEWLERPQMAFTQVCATLEAEMAQLEGSDAEDFMAEFGIEDRALDRVIRESYRLLGSISFFTVGIRRVSRLVDPHRNAGCGGRGGDPLGYPTRFHPRRGGAPRIVARGRLTRSVSPARHAPTGRKDLSRPGR